MKNITFLLMLLFFATQSFGQTLDILPQGPALCHGTGRVLYVKGGGSNFTWSPATGLSATTGDSVFAAPLATVTYTVTGLDSLGQSASGVDEVDVVPRPNKPTITTSGDTLISSATQANQWYVDDSLISGATDQAIILGVNGCYKTIVTNPANSCFNTSDTICVSILTLDIEPQAPVVCYGAGVTLIAVPYEPGINYTWRPAAGLSATTGDTVLAFPTISTTYTVTGVDSSGHYIVNENFVSVTVVPPPNKPVIIIYSTDSLISSATQGNQWYRNDTLIAGATNQVYVFGPAPACYTDVVTNPANSCTVTSDSTCIHGGGALALDIEPQSPTICSNTGVLLTVPASGSNYVWSPADGLNTTTGNTVIASPSVATTYTVTGLDSLGRPVAGYDVVDVMPSPNKPIIYLSQTGDTLISTAIQYDQWFVNDTLIAGATDQYCVPPKKGWYQVSIVNPASGCSSKSDSLLVGANNVWPGDVNEDLVVNNYDLIPIGLYYGETGTARDTTTNSWAPHACLNWNSLQSSSVNKKYVDCNGDGTINADDTLAINLNYGLNHPLDEPFSSPERSSGTVQFTIVADSNSYHNGSIVHASVLLGTGGSQATAIYGLAYNISVNSSVVKPGTLAFSYANSFLGTKGTNVIALTHVVNDVETAIVGTDHADKAGNGKIGDLYFTFAGNITSSLGLTISSYQAVDAHGNKIGLSVASGINTLTQADDKFSIYPNPSGGEITVASDKNIDEVKVTNVLGQLIYQTQPGSIKLKFELKDEGMYFVAVTSNNVTHVQKVMVVK